MPLVSNHLTNSKPSNKMMLIVIQGGAHGLIGVDPGDGQFEEALDAGDGGDADVDIDAVRLAGQLQVN